MPSGRNLVICCDGTWNTRAQEAATNVFKLFNALQQDATQRAYYHSGVGTSGRALSWALGGATGLGLSNDIIQSYFWLTSNYQKGDRIWIFGFSRGAYTARSLAGMIAACGIIRVRENPWATISQLYRDVYRKKQPIPDGLEFSFHPREPASDEHPYPVYFIGVWDTVGALGVPEYFGLLNALQNVLGFLDKTSVLDWFSKVSPLAALPLPMYFGFHDVRLNPRVKHARHALALDEQRAPFTPTLWDEANSERVQQVWFPGSHMDVGGGYAQAGLSDGALLWMINEARRAQPEALRFIDALVLEIEANANPRDVLHDDNRDAFAAVPPVYAVIKPVLDYLFEPRPRAVPPIDETSRVTDGAPRRSVHQSAYDRQKAPFVGSGFYRTHRVLENHAGGTAVEVNAPVAVDACEDWNSTGLYLETGRYSFTAKGQWSNLERWSGPNGEADLSRSEAVALLRHHPVKALQRACAAVAGRFKSIVVWATKNPNSNVVLCRREEREPWMSLVGVVANGGIEPDGKYRKHQTFGIGGKKECTVWQPGYLYAFANDAPGLYNDNFGTVELQVERLQ